MAFVVVVVYFGFFFFRSFKLFETIAGNLSFKAECFTMFYYTRFLERCFLIVILSRRV